MPEISILHPTRERPQKSMETIKRWLARSGVDSVETIVSVDENDPRLSRYRQLYSTLLINPNRSAVDAVNRAAENATGRIMIVVSDDTDCPSNWGRLILNATKGKKDFVLKVYDGTQNWLVTQPILDRVYYERFGYVYNPAYLHQFADTEFTHVADILKRIIWRNDLLFPHRHYSVLKQRPDALYRRNDATWNQGKRIYLRRCKEKFGLGAVNIYKLSAQGHQHIRWMKANHL